MLTAVASALSMLVIVAGCSSASSPGPSSLPGAATTSPAPASPAASIAIPSIAIASAPAGGGNGNVAPMPCDRLAPLVTQIMGLSIAEIDASPDDCSFTVNTSGDSSTSGFGGIVDIRRESTSADDYDLTVSTFTGADGVDVPGVGDKARRTSRGTLMYAVHGGQLWAVQQELLVSDQDVIGNASKLMLALFGLV